MRPVNLIPPEERRGDRAPTRTGALPYVILGALVAVLAGVAMTVLTSNKISDRKAEVATLEAQRAEAQARADALQPYADLANLATQRSSTVTSLAQSRFDWDRVLRELSLVIPDDVWLTQLGGTVTPEVQLADAPQVSLRDQVPGPALAIVGCGASHEAVASFLQSLRDIDGVTRVAIESDSRPDQTSNVSAGGGGASAADCRTRRFISQFKIVAAFDAVSVPAAATPAAPAAEAVPTADGVGDAQAEEQKVRDSTETQTERARDAVEIVPGVAH
jgi:Tfp pilus assembly protein PilN